MRAPAALAILGLVLSVAALSLRASSRAQVTQPSDMIASTGAMALTAQYDVTAAMGAPVCASGDASCTRVSQVCDAEGGCVTIKQGVNALRLYYVRIAGGVATKTEVGTLAYTDNGVTAAPGKLAY